MQLNWPDISFGAINLWSAPNISKSPCIGLCKLVDGRCIGCNRTIKEIEEYGKLSNHASIMPLESSTL